MDYILSQDNILDYFYYLVPWGNATLNDFFKIG